MLEFERGDLGQVLSVGDFRMARQHFQAKQILAWPREAKTQRFRHTWQSDKLENTQAPVAQLDRAADF